MIQAKIFIVPVAVLFLVGCQIQQSSTDIGTLNFNYPPITAIAGETITPAAPGGTIISTVGTDALIFTVAGSPFPAGLTLNPDTGTISGTPSAMQPETGYTVEASVKAGNTAYTGKAVAQALITITANDISPLSFNYPPITAKAGETITPAAPGGTLISSVGPNVLTFSTTSELPSGLALNPDTGTISGTPTVSQTNVQYTVRVEVNPENTRYTGSSSATVSIVVYDFTVTLLTGTGYLHQSIIDDSLPDSTVIATINGVNDGPYIYALGRASGQKTAAGGSFTIIKSDIKNCAAADGDKLSIGISQESLYPVAVYKPYEIHTWQDLQAMRHSLSGSYTIMEDIQFPDPGVDNFPASGFQPIGHDTSFGIGDGKNGFQGTPFRGYLNGNSKKISDLYIDNTNLDYVGLFGKITADFNDEIIVENIHLHSPDITANSVAGALAGYLAKGTVSNIKVSTPYKQTTVEANGESIPSDITGVEVDATGRKPKDSIISLAILMVTVNINVQMKLSYVGGIVGAAGVGTIMLDCYNEGNIASTGWMVGGLAGTIRASAFLRGYNSGNIRGSSNSMIFGGLVGGSSGNMVGFNSGDIHACDVIGGLVGLLTDGDILYGPDDDKYFTGIAIGYAYGGFTAAGIFSSDGGMSGGLVGSCGERGTVIGYVPSSNDVWHLDGAAKLVGHSSGIEPPIIYAYWGISTGTQRIIDPAYPGSIQLYLNINQIKWDGASYYFDKNDDNTMANDGSEPRVFNDPIFMEYFDISDSSPGNGKWPHLKKDYFSVLDQPSSF